MSLNERPAQPGGADTPAGFAYALTAYLMWGFLPLYMKAVAYIPAIELVAHRILWSLPIAAVILLVRRRFGDIAIALKTPRTLMMAAVTATLIAVNWSIYVWAIAAGRAVETALGYYINPLFSIFLGFLLLGERLDTRQKAAIALAVVAVAVLAFEAGGLPWVSVGLAVTWGFYAYFKRSLPVGPNQGFFLEVVMLAVPSLAYIVYVEARGDGHFFTEGVGGSALIMAAGLVTAIPLMVYANGAKLLRLSTIGIMQYIAPTMIFIIAVFVFREPFGPYKLVAFVLIWISLAIYSSSLFRQSRARARMAQTLPGERREGVS